MLEVVAARTEGFQSMPTTAASTYALVAASVSDVGAARLVIFWLLRLTLALGVPIELNVTAPVPEVTSLPT